MQVNLDEVVTYLRELLCLNRTQLLGEIGTVPDRFRDKAKKTELITFALEKKFNPNVRPFVAAGQGYDSLTFGRFTES